MRSVVAALLVLALSLATAHAGFSQRVAQPRCPSAIGAEGCALIQLRALSAPTPEPCKGGSALASLLMTGVALPDSPAPSAPRPLLSLPVTEAGAQSPWKPPPHRS